MRRAVWLRSLTAASSTGASEREGRGGPEALVNPLPPPFETRPFRSLPLHDWQIHGTRGGRALLPPGLLSHGEALGPRPLLILDHSLPPPGTIRPNPTLNAGDLGITTSTSISSNSGSISSNSGSISGSNSGSTGGGAPASCPSHAQLDSPEGAAAKYASMVSRLGWAYGVVYIPLVVDLDDGDAIGRSCQQVVAVMDALDIRWTSFLTYSYGTLVAGRLAASQAYPHRIGSFLSLDTPLVTDRMVRNAKHRAEILKAEKDVNVPAEMFSFVREELLGSLEEVLPCAAPEADGELYEKYLFNPEQIYEKGGLIRKEERYVPLRHLSEIYHPWQLVVPAAQPLSDVPVHKDFFRLRRPAVIKSAGSHKDLFSDSAAAEIAEVLGSWMNRFEPDVMIKRRYEQAAKEMSALTLDSTASAPKGGSIATTSGGGKRKKEKKEKKQKPG